LIDVSSEKNKPVGYSWLDSTNVT